jgi:hypothetical protein
LPHFGAVARELSVLWPSLHPASLHFAGVRVDQFWLGFLGLRSHAVAPGHDEITHGILQVVKLFDDSAFRSRRYIRNSAYQLLREVNALSFPAYISCSQAKMPASTALAAGSRSRPDLRYRSSSCVPSRWECPR